MFEIKDGKITLNKTKALTPKQVATINQMYRDSDRTQYIMSLMGLIKKPVNVKRLKVEGEDVLHDKPKGKILRAMSRIRDLDRDHKPSETGLGQWVGVEIECIIPTRRDFRAGGDECNCEYDQDGDLEVECDYCQNGGDDDYADSQARKWLKKELLRAGVNRCCVKRDGSLEDDDGHGVEVTILFNSQYGYEPLTKLCDALRASGCYVNETCGLHVHLDARHLTVKAAERVGASLGNALPILKWMVTPDRQTNHYCKLCVSPLIKANMGDDNWQKRYCAVNLMSYPLYKTIEVRLHQGSIIADNIEAWINLLKQVGGAKLKQPIETFQDFIDVVKLSESMIEYCESRISEHNPEAWTILTQGPDTDRPLTETQTTRIVEGA